MKRSRLARSNVLVCTLILSAPALLATGCGDDDSPGTDSGSLPGRDAGPGVDSGPGPGIDGGPGWDGGCTPSFEICGDGMDQNCDGREDSCGNTDGDSFEACRTGEAPPACDCNDREATIYPGAPEICNSIDDDCDGRVDEIAACCAACTGMAERADACTPEGACVCSTEGAGDAPCAAGRACCSSGCADLQTDFNNCGLCQSQCTAQADHCSAGLCGCGSGPPCDKAVMCSGGSC